VLWVGVHQVRPAQIKKLEVDLSKEIVDAPGEELKTSEKDVGVVWSFAEQTDRQTDTFQAD
jgi:hypothetical protein